jgi:hypothetical protein
MTLAHLAPEKRLGARLEHLHELVSGIGPEVVLALRRRPLGDNRNEDAEERNQVVGQGEALPWPLGLIRQHIQLVGASRVHDHAILRAAKTGAKALPAPRLFRFGRHHKPAKSRRQERRGKGKTAATGLATPRRAKDEDSLARILEAPLILSSLTVAEIKQRL